MGHDHHHHLPVDHLNRAFVLGIVLNLVFVCVEFGAGLWFDSVALISDAGHNLSDVVSLVLSLIAFRLARVKPTASYTYGYRKSTVLVSLLNACILLVAVGVILVESVRKLYDPQPVDGDSIAWVAGIGIVINAFTAWLFIRDKEKDLNVKGAYLHMAADTLVSVGVLVSGIVIRLTGWYAIDPVVGIAIALVILFSTSKLLHDSLRLSLDGVPVGIDSVSFRPSVVVRRRPYRPDGSRAATDAEGSAKTVFFFPKIDPTKISRRSVSTNRPPCRPYVAALPASRTSPGSISGRILS